MNNLLDSGTCRWPLQVSDPKQNRLRKKAVTMYSISDLLEIGYAEELIWD